MLLGEEVDAATGATRPAPTAPATLDGFFVVYSAAISDRPLRVEAIFLVTMVIDCIFCLGILVDGPDHWATGALAILSIPLNFGALYAMIRNEVVWLTLYIHCTFALVRAREESMLPVETALSTHAFHSCAQGLSFVARAPSPPQPTHAHTHTHTHTQRGVLMLLYRCLRLLNWAGRWWRRWCMRRTGRTSAGCSLRSHSSPRR
eukprot:SAG22_NODE_1987_length_3201_cov_12.979046_5_plen_204_part_00